MDRADTMASLGAYMDQLLAQSTPQRPAWNLEMLRSGKANKWNYIDGCMITAVLSLYEITGEPRYLRFADDFLDWYIQEDGGIRTYDRAEYNLDNINPAKNLFPLHALTGKEKYRLALDNVRAQLDEMPRTRAGSFWHKQIYPWQVWLDGLYMAQPFYMQYEAAYNGLCGYRDVFTQFRNVHALMRRPDGLYAHAYDESRAMYWADPQTGQSPHCWLRALGWFAAALVDTLQVTDERLYYEYRFLQTMLRELMDAALPWQDAGGMFHQIIDHPAAKGNYLETSGTALLAYALLKAVRLSLLPAAYAAPAEKAFFGATEKYLSRDKGGVLCLGGICLVAGLGGPQRRDGSLDYYFSEPVVENEAKGVAPLLLAYGEILRREAGERRGAAPDPAKGEGPLWKPPFGRGR